MRYDVNAEYDLTDKGQELLQAYREGGMEDVLSDRQKGSYLIAAHAVTMTFLVSIDNGMPTGEIYHQLTRRQSRRIVKVVEDTFDSMVQEGVIEQVDDLHPEHPYRKGEPDTPLPSAFQKDFGIYE